MEGLGTAGGGVTGGTVIEGPREAGCTMFSEVSVRQRCGEGLGVLGGVGVGVVVGEGAGVGGGVVFGEAIGKGSMPAGEVSSKGLI